MSRLTQQKRKQKVGNIMTTPPFVHQLVGPENLSMPQDEDTTRDLQEGEIEVQTLFSAISPGTELAAYFGAPPLRPTTKIYPRLLGYCNVGVINRVGSGTKELSVGDRILTHAAHRTNFISGSSDILAKLPAGVDAKLASTTYLFHLGYNACLRAGVRAGHRVAVIGLGTLGLTSAAVAHLSGASVVGFSNHIAPDFSYANFGFDAVQSKHASQSDEQFDVVITTSNSWRDWELALTLARPGGIIAVIGFPGRDQDAPTMNPLASEYFYDKQLSIVSCGYTPNIDVAEQDVRFTMKRNCSYLLKAVTDGRLPGHALITKVVPANELENAYRELNSNPSRCGTIVLDWNL